MPWRPHLWNSANASSLTTGWTCTRTELCQRYGAGPRATQYMVLGAKARAALDGRQMPDFEDLEAVAPTVLTHRLVINFAAEAAGRTAGDIVGELVKAGGWR